MNKQIKFEDNIFITMMRIRMIRDTITLDADPELFLEKTLDDIGFADRAMACLLESLRNNPYLFERDELLHRVLETEWQFTELISDFLNHEGNISVSEIPSICDKLAGFRNSSLERQKIAGTLCSMEDGRTESPIVSSEELSELLKAF